jgi:hypothetical protein
MRNLFPEVGHRSVQNAWHGARVSQLREYPEFAWLFEGRRETLHTELGRFPDTKSFVDAARWICQTQPKVRVGVAILRRWRLSLEGKEDFTTEGLPFELGRRIVNTINEYVACYPGTTPSVIVDALEMVRSIVSKE